MEIKSVDILCEKKYVFYDLNILKIKIINYPLFKLKSYTNFNNEQFKFLTIKKCYKRLIVFLLVVPQI